MPQRKKGRQQNKKKNKKKNGGAPPIRTRQTPSGASNRSGGSAAKLGQCLEGQRPSNFNMYIDRRRQDIQDKCPSFYLRYKEATKRFMDYMIQKTPKYVEGNRKSVNFIVVAADWMADSATSGSFVLNPSILKDLKISIRMRSKAAKSSFGGGDAGHEHLLSCLVYCWTVLVSLPQLRDEDKKETATAANRFEVLMEEEEEEEMDENMFPSTPVPRPKPMPEVALTIEELKTADDRTDITLFLLNLNGLMGMVRNHYESLCISLPTLKSMDIHNSAMVEATIEAAVATNMAIQQVQQLEMELQQQHPHLTTPYRMISTLVLPEITKDVSRVVREQGDSTDIPSLEKEITIFLGDCLECNFRSRSDPFNDMDTVVKFFCTKLKVNEHGASEIQEICHKIQNSVVLEAPMPYEMQLTRYLRKKGLSQYPDRKDDILKGHSWLMPTMLPNIAGDRSIIHTLRLIQIFGATIANVADDKFIEPKRGLFGPTRWCAGRATKIYGDLDELFMSDILPQWFLMCRDGIIGKVDLPRENELLTLFVLMRQFVKAPGSPVSFSLTFGLHAMLTAILETDKIFNESLEINETIFNDYFQQLEDVSYSLGSERDTELSKHKNNLWTHNMTMVAFLKNFGLDVFNKRALWNPLCAGTTFSILCFFGNLEAGCTMIDCQHQLRITLHLFNALKINGIIKEDQVPLLDQIHKSFKKSRGVWEGPLPQRGELVKRFWICFGMNPKDAKKMAENSKLAVRRHEVDTNFEKMEGRNRKMNPVKPAEIATCYRRICNRDFHDVLDKYHNDEQRQRCGIKGTDLYPYIVRSNDTLDAIDYEQHLLSLNLPACGALMEHFVCGLGRAFQWAPHLDEEYSIPDYEKRPRFSVMFAQHLLGALDFADDPFNHEFLKIPMGKASSIFMSGFFNSIDPACFVWFQAVRGGVVPGCRIFQAVREDD